MLNHSYKVNIRIALFFSIIFLSKIISAQSIGLKLGANYSNLKGVDIPDDRKWIFRPAAYLFYEYKYNRYMNIRIGVNYTALGTDMSETIPVTQVGTYTVYERLNYIEIPASFKIKMTEKRSTAYFFGGGSISYLVKNNRVSKAFFENTTIEVKSDQYFPYQNSKFDLRAFSGFGFNIKRFLFDFSYSFGVLNIYKGKDVPSGRNRFFAASFGYYIIRPKQKWKW